MKHTCLIKRQPLIIGPAALERGRCASGALVRSSGSGHTDGEIPGIAHHTHRSGKAIKTGVETRRVREPPSIGAAHARTSALRAFIHLLGEQQSHWHPREPQSLARGCRCFNEPKFWRFQTDRRATRNLGAALDKLSEAGPARFHWRGQHRADCRRPPRCSLSSLEAALAGLPPMPCCIEKCWLKECRCLWRPPC